MEERKKNWLNALYFPSFSSTILSVTFHLSLSVMRSERIVLHAIFKVQSNMSFSPEETHDRFLFGFRSSFEFGFVEFCDVHHILRSFEIFFRIYK